MATTTSPNDISLRGVPESLQDVQPGASSAIFFKLSDEILQDFKKNTSNLYFTAGSTPKLRIGTRTIDLSISNDDFRNELFASTVGSSLSDFTFQSIISHRAEVKDKDQRPSDESVGTDEAVAALQSTMAAIKQEREAKQTTVTSAVLAIPKNRWDAARKEKQDKKRSNLGGQGVSVPASPSLSEANTPRLGPAPTSAPASEEQVKAQAIRFAVIHLLAMRPASIEEVAKKTQVSRDVLAGVLDKVGTQSEEMWQLKSTTYKELDIWKFGYLSDEDRQAAVDNAAKAFDRLRLGGEDQLWQMLLPENERGKGKVLSRLLGIGQMSRGLTPNYQPSPMPRAGGGTESKTVSGANTPRLGSSTPRPGNSRGDLTKRLLAKDPKKAHAAEEAKEYKRKVQEEKKKRKEQEMAAASDRESGRPTKKQASKKADPKIKSAEFVRSSDEESGSEGEIQVEKKKASKSEADSSKKATIAKPRPARTTSSDSSDVPIKKVAENSAVKAKADKSAAKKPAPPTNKVSEPVKTAGKSTPQRTTGNGLSAPSSQHKGQPSPQFPNSRPSVPSPLGAARPRVASDVSDRGAVGVQKVRQGNETLKGLGISDGIQKRSNTPSGTGSTAPQKMPPQNVQRKKESAEKQLKPTTNGTLPIKPFPGTKNQTDGNAKRKAEDSPSQQSVKHRKSDSGSSQSQKSLPSTVGAPNDRAMATPDITFDKGNSDSADSVIDTMSFEQGMTHASKFQTALYPRYTELYDKTAAQIARGEKVSQEDREKLMKMHERIKTIKQELRMASHREPPRPAKDDE